MATKKEILEALKRAKDSTPEYPPELKTATKAEYMTMVNKMDKKSKRRGCPLMLLTYAGIFFGSLYAFYWAYTHVIYQVMIAFTWFVSQ